jgi:hypothetical protein
MEKDDFLQDDFLREMLQQHPLDAPSDEFVGRVMAAVSPATEPARVSKPFSFYLRAAVPYIIGALAAVLVISTSDLPVFNWLPGKRYFLNTLMPYFDASMTMLKNAFSSKYVSWAIMISVSAGILFLVDRVLSRRFTA